MLKAQTPGPAAVRRSAQAVPAFQPSYSQCSTSYTSSCCSTVSSSSSRWTSEGHTHLQRAPTSAVCRAVRQSVDPVAPSSWQPKRVGTLHSPEQLKMFLDPAGEHANKLVVMMAKASHCRPCKKFAPTYAGLAERFADAVFLEIVGDANPENRKLMMEMKIKVTPSFFVWRNGQQVYTMTGTKRLGLANALVGLLKPGEQGAVWSEPPVMVDSDSEDDD